MRLGLLACFALLGVPPASAQGGSRSLVFAGAGIGALQVDNPHGGSGVVEMFGGVRRRIPSGVLMSAALRRTTRMDQGYNAICFIRPEGGCWPTPVVPDSYWALELSGLLSPVGGVPLSFLAGAGLAKPLRRGIAVPETGTGATQGTWRAGLELDLSGTHRGPRLQLIRVWFPAGLMEARSQTTISVTLP